MYVYAVILISALSGHVRVGTPLLVNFCLGMAMSGEAQVEARRDTDAQIVRYIWVKGRKTHRTIW